VCFKFEATRISISILPNFEPKKAGSSCSWLLIAPQGFAYMELHARPIRMSWTGSAMKPPSNTDGSGSAPPRASGHVGRMNRTIKESTVKRYQDGSHEQPKPPVMVSWRNFTSLLRAENRSCSLLKTSPAYTAGKREIGRQGIKIGSRPVGSVRG